MKILLITSGFPKKGRIAGIWIPDLIHELNTLGCHIHILTQNCDHPKTEEETLWQGCDITYFKWQGGETPLVNILERGVSGIPIIFQFFIRGIYEGMRICRKWQPDILLAEWLIPSGFMAYVIAKLYKIPYAVRALGSDVLKAEQNPIIRMIVGRIAKSSHVLFADGFDLCKKTAALAGGKSCVFAATSRKLDFKRSGFKIPDNPGFFTTCTVGRLHPVKGQDILIAAARVLVERGIRFRSYIIGEGTEFDRYRDMIGRACLDDYVILTGRLEDGDIADFLHHVDCIVIPSRSESIPLAFGEAIAARKPMIVTSVGDLPYLVGKYELGYVIPPDSPVALADAMEKMSLHPRDRFFAEEKTYQELDAMLSTEGAAKVMFEALAACKGEERL
jgi:glycosyltransferase involved in cell wall biosynthesis